MQLEGKSAIVTGGASGFGAEIAKRFITEGARVSIADINIKAAKEHANDIGALAHYVDISDRQSVQEMVKEALSAHTKIDILVNNAGVAQRPMPLDMMSEAEFDYIFNVNAKSVFLTARSLVKHFKSNGNCAILNIASSAGLSPRPGLNWYNASKGWMITATKTMAVELAPFGIRVNALCPVAGETPLLKHFLGEDTPEKRAQFLTTIPLGRFCTPQDVASAATFLCSEDASMITGVAMEIDGGRCI